VAVILSEVLVQISQIKAVVDATKKVFPRNNGFKIECIEQMVLTAWLTPQHLDYSPQNAICIFYHREYFNTIGRLPTFTCKQP